TINATSISNLTLHPGHSYKITPGSQWQYTQLEAATLGSGDNVSFDASTFVGSVMMSGAGNDTLLGSPGQDYIEGGAGDDLIKGALGFDDLRGGPGNDTIYANSSSYQVHGGDGNDLLYLDGGSGSTM